MPYLEGKSPLLMSNIQVNFGHVLPENSKSSAFWDMGVDSHLKWLLLFSPNEFASWDSTSLCMHELPEAGYMQKVVCEFAITQVTHVHRFFPFLK